VVIIRVAALSDVYVFITIWAIKIITTIFNINLKHLICATKSTGLFPIKYIENPTKEINNNIISYVNILVSIFLENNIF
jgi:hypothetical protein